jgi:origin recognition complex subunit 5
MRFFWLSSIINYLEENFKFGLLQRYSTYKIPQRVFIHLLTIYQPSFPTPPSLVLHGLQATGKTAVTKAVLQASKTPHAIIDSRECITGRQLLERSFAASVEALSKLSDVEIDVSGYGRCENLSALQVHLERLLEDQKRFTLVFDGIDQQREAPSTLIPALARFGETVCMVLIVLSRLLTLDI